MCAQVLSDGVFESKYCMQELASAVNAGVEVVLITKEGSRWPNRNGDMVEIFPPPELIDALEPPECRTAFTRRAITHTNEYYAAFSHNLMQSINAAIKEHRQQHGEPPPGQDNPDRLVLAQRKQLMLARSQDAEHHQARSIFQSEPAAIATLETATALPVALLDITRLEQAIKASEAEADADLLSQARLQLKRAHTQADLTEKVKLEAAQNGTACEFYFMRTKNLLDREGSSLPRFQDVLATNEQAGPSVSRQDIAKDTDDMVSLYLTSIECCQHLFREKVLVVSHRWDSPEQPDPSGKQLQALKKQIRANPQYDYVWIVRSPFRKHDTVTHIGSQSSGAEVLASTSPVRRTIAACPRASVP